jgi:DNA repair exonuclease SbcCD nuclease subunit
MAHCANALLAERLLSRPVPRTGFDEGFQLLIFHGSLDNVGIPSRKLRTLPFSEAELASQGFDYAAVGHYHEQADFHDADGRVIGAYAGCPAGRGLDEIGEKFVLVGRIDRRGTERGLQLEKVRLDTRVIRRVDVRCQGVTHREALLQRIEDSLSIEAISGDDLLHIRLVGRIAPGIDRTIPDEMLEDRFFHVSFDTSRLEPDYDLDRYRDEALKTTEARFVREMRRRIDSENDVDRRRLLENALHYGLDALILGDVSPRYED